MACFRLAPVLVHACTSIGGPAVVRFGIMSPENLVPNETREIEGSQAMLYLGVSMVNQNIPADRLAIEDKDGTRNDYLIFSLKGQRRVVQIEESMTAPTSSPAVDVNVSFGEEVSDIPLDPDRMKDLLTIYDRFEQRTYRNSSSKSK